tara:strand:- start:1130 stop:1366 length:237 start_codon:yes stop_codon:yes gene_type:complete
LKRKNTLLDLRSVPCPLNVVKCKLALEKLTPLTSLIVDLDLGEPEIMVKHSLENEGYKCEIIKKNKEFIRYSITNEFS